MRHRMHGAGRLPHDELHREAWNSALDSAVTALLDNYAEGQLVSREDVIRLIRSLFDYGNEPEPR